MAVRTGVTQRRDPPGYRRNGCARTYGWCDVVVDVGGGDEADEEAALADGGVPDEQDLEGAVVAARRRRGALPNPSRRRGLGNGGWGQGDGGGGGGGVREGQATAVQVRRCSGAGGEIGQPDGGSV